MGGGPVVLKGLAAGLGQVGHRVDFGAARFPCRRCAIRPPAALRPPPSLSSPNASRQSIQEVHHCISFTIRRRLTPAGTPAKSDGAAPGRPPVLPLRRRTETCPAPQVAGVRNAAGRLTDASHVPRPQVPASLRMRPQPLPPPRPGWPSAIRNQGRNPGNSFPLAAPRSAPSNSPPPGPAPRRLPR